MKLLIIIFLIVYSFLVFCTVALTKSKQREWFNLGSVLVIVLFGIVSIYRNYSDTDFNFSVSFIYFLAIGGVGPRLIATIINQNRIESPVFFIKRKSKSLEWALSFISWVFLAIMVVQPHKIRMSNGTPIYDENYFRTLVSFLFLLIPSLIYTIISMLQRTAFCKNGLFHAGLLTDWSDFRSYSWPQGEIYADRDIQAFVNKEILVDLLLETKGIFLVKQIRVEVPFYEKSRIENLLSRKIKAEAKFQDHALPKPA
jgi:hypothetical protein